LENHYSYSFNELARTYEFLTKNSLLYKVAFVVDTTFSTISGEEIEDVYQLVIDSVNDGFEHYDSKVAKTIIHLIESFFLNTSNSILYICSNDKGQAFVRSKVFDRWYRTSKLNTEILKVDKVFSINISDEVVESFYTSFLYHKANKNYEYLLMIYENLERSINDK